MTSPDNFCGVPEDLATQMTWGWSAGKLEFRFRHAKNEKAMLLQLSDWLERDESNAIKLAEFMQNYEASFSSSFADDLARISEREDAA